MIAAALQLVDSVDTALTAGLARLVPAQTEALAEFASAFVGSPLGGTVGGAIAALTSGDPSPHHLVALAAGRTALLGSVHDALLAEAGVPLATTEVAAAPPVPVELRPRLDGLRQWLAEVALAGFAQLDAAMLTPILPSVSELQRVPTMARLAAFTSGFVDELLANAPTSALPEVPARRWGDLWSRALLGTVALPEVPATRTVRGTVQWLGPDVRHHDHLVSVVLHGVLEEGGQRRFVRSTYSSWKVDAIAGLDVWNLLRPQAPAVFAALATSSLTEVEGELSGTGALTVRTVLGATPADPFAVDLGGVLYTPAAPRDRHPLQLALPARDVGPVDPTRMSPLLDLSAELADAASVLGLRRWDGQWTLQPMQVRTKKGKVGGLANAFAAADKLKTDARAVLGERASRLLRAS